MIKVSAKHAAKVARRTSQDIAPLPASLVFKVPKALLPYVMNFAAVPYLI